MKIVVAIGLLIASVAAQTTDDGWLKWSASNAEAIGKAAYVTGHVGGIFDTRLLKTERAYNYKLAATWIHPDVVRASARVAQLRDRLTDDEAKTLVAEAEKAGDTVVIVDIDPREGSGVIPSDWAAFLQADTPDGVEPRAVRGHDTPKLREVKALGGVLRRNYDYDRFWVRSRSRTVMAGRCSPTATPSLNWWSAFTIAKAASAGQSRRRFGRARETLNPCGAASAVRHPQRACGRGRTVL